MIITTHEITEQELREALGDRYMLLGCDGVLEIVRKGVSDGLQDPKENTDTVGKSSSEEISV